MFRLQTRDRSFVFKPWLSSHQLVLPVGLTAIIYGLFILARLAVHGYDPSYFVVAGSNYYDASTALPSLRAIRDGDGYDGQFYYRLAIEPFSHERVDHGIALDAPAYRQQRILYPLPTWLASAGRPASVPVTLIVLNYLGICAIAWLGARLANDLGSHALWGVAFSLYPGFIFTIARDLTEIISSTLLLAGIFQARRSRHASAAMWLCFAVLTRETTLLVPAAILMRQYITDGSRSRGGWYYALSIILYAGWSTYLRMTWTGAPTVQLVDAFGVPLGGMMTMWQRAIMAPNRLLTLWCFETAMLGLLGFLALRCFRHHKEYVAETIALIMYIALALCLRPKYWAEDQSFLRVTTELFLLSMLGVVLGRRRTAFALSSIWILLALCTFRWRVEW